MIRDAGSADNQNVAVQLLGRLETSRKIAVAGMQLVNHQRNCCTRLLRLRLAQGVAALALQLRHLLHDRFECERSRPVV